MGIKRETIKRGKFEKGEKKVATAAVGPQRRYGPRPANIIAPGMSNSEARMVINASNNTGVSSEALNNVSEERRADILVRGTTSGGLQTGSPSPVIVYSNSFKKTQEDLKKYAATTSLSTGSGTGSFGVPSGGDTIRQAPEVYSPLFQIANLQLPRDRITMNAWNRNFYDTHPLVHNCINLHSTYPIGKINIRCKHKKVEAFFKK